MIARLFIGCVLGLLAGAAVAAGLAFGLHTTTFEGSIGVVLAFASAALTGVLAGLVAGKPIWAHGASIEVGLKAVFGAILGTIAMVALRKWAAGVHVDMSALGVGGAGGLGDVPAAALPLVGAALGGLFELDNTADGPKQGVGKRVGTRPDGVRVDTGKSSKASKPGARSDGEVAPGDEEDVRKRAKG
jgi:hypothetical protein